MTCLCLTRNRRQWLPRAIQCFQRQGYPNRELLILADGEDVKELAEAEASGAGNIRYVHLSSAATIGEKRNLGTQLAEGELIVSWDDDDWSAPGRIADQVARLRRESVSVTGYHAMFFTDGRTWWKYTGHKSANLGTSLCYRKEWWHGHPFPPKHIGEDSGFIGAAIRARQYVAADAGELMVASIHRGNTSPRTLAGKAWARLPMDFILKGYPA